MHHPIARLVKSWVSSVKEMGCGPCLGGFGLCGSIFHLSFMWRDGEVWLLAMNRLVLVMPKVNVSVAVKMLLRFVNKTKKCFNRAVWWLAEKTLQLTKMLM